MNFISNVSRLAILSFAMFFCSARASAQDNLKLEDSTTVVGIVRGQLKDAVIKTANNRFYEVTEKANLSVGLSQPTVKIYKDGRKYKMLLPGLEKPIACNKISDVIESNIDGGFKGWDGTTTFKLQNRQEWKQDAPSGNVFSNLFNPAVLIYSTSEGYKMKVEGVNEDPIIVKKIK